MHNYFLTGTIKIVIQTSKHSCITIIRTAAIAEIKNITSSTLFLFQFTPSARLLHFPINNRFKIFICNISNGTIRKMDAFEMYRPQISAAGGD